MNKLRNDFDKNARFEGTSYQDILDIDTREAPASLRAQEAPYLGSDPIPASVYTSQERFDLEAEKMWMRVWQMACREEEIPNVGDHIIYEIVGKSVLVVRSAPDRIQAFYNVCLHRGRRLVDEGGCREAFRCPFHGFTWNIDGSFKEHPFPWDFQHLGDEDLRLPEIKVGTWGGFVFVNFDENAPELMDVIGPLDWHFKDWNLENRYIKYQVAKIVDCNWKALAEAFMESHHTIDTHPQIMPYLADVNSQYDVFSDYVTRQISATGVSSPHLPAGSVSEQDIVDTMMARRGSDDQIKVPEGVKARAFMAQLMRDGFHATDGHDYDKYADAELLDAILYNLFPNFSVWGGAMPTRVYRWRPVGRDVNRGIMEVYQLDMVPKDGERPKPSPTHWLSDDEPWTAAEEMGGLGAVLDQDLGNLPFVQQGLISSGNNKVHLANYQEMRIRQHHIMIEKYIKGEI